MTDGKRYFRAREISCLTGVSLRTVRRWIAAGILPSTKLGGARLVPGTGLERLFSPASEATNVDDKGNDE
jgi:excisionase family DNA binding protein